jgi:hypothetical protein
MKSSFQRSNVNDNLDDAPGPESSVPDTTIFVEFAFVAVRPDILDSDLQRPGTGPRQLTRVGWRWWARSRPG